MLNKHYWKQNTERIYVIINFTSGRLRLGGSLRVKKGQAVLARAKINTILWFFWPFERLAMHELWCVLLFKVSKPYLKIKTYDKMVIFFDEKASKMISAS